MEEGVRVILGMESGEIAEEVMHLLDRGGKARVVASADDDRRLAEAVRQLEPDVVVAQPSLCGALDAGRHVLMALDTRESVGSLRTALSAGAKGYFVWPGDREALGTTVGTIRPMVEPGAIRGRVIGVHAARGGCGATFLATQLAGAFARVGRSCIVIDADPIGADVGPSIGAPDEGVHTAAVLLQMGDELTTGHVVDALWAHTSGFKALLAPPPDPLHAAGAEAWRRVVLTSAGLAEAVLVDLGSSPAPEWIEATDRVLEVLSPDVRSFRAAARFLDVTPPVERGFVLNRAGRAELVAGDVARAFGSPPIAVIPTDAGLARTQSAGRLVPERGRVGRVLGRLASQLFADAATEVETGEVQVLRA